jgi:hypothetical protein
MYQQHVSTAVCCQISAMWLQSLYTSVLRWPNHTASWCKTPHPYDAQLVLINQRFLARETQGGRLSQTHLIGRQTPHKLGPDACQPPHHPNEAGAHQARIKWRQAKQSMPVAPPAQLQTRASINQALHTRSSLARNQTVPWCDGCLQCCCSLQCC